MKLIVGLGNPGKKYEGTRHNVGFILLGRYAEENGLDWKFEKKFNAEVAKEGETLFVKPQTFMNKSGESVRKVVDYYNVDLNDLLIVHDDVDLEAGKVRKQFDRGHAGHNGIKNIVKHLGTKAFWRQRVGVGHSTDPKIDTETWVLMEFDAALLENVVLAAP